jgi:hypothetical protein
MKLPASLPVWFAATALVASHANLVWMVISLHPNILALQLSFTAESFWHVIDSWGPSGVAIYLSTFAYDTVHPFIYGAFGYLVVSRTALFSNAGDSARSFFLFSLPVAGFFDLLENGAHLHLLAQPPGSGALIVPLSGTCSAIKWGLAVLFALALAIQIFRQLRAGFALYRCRAKDCAGR